MGKSLTFAMGNNRILRPNTNELRDTQIPENEASTLEVS